MKRWSWLVVLITLVWACPAGADDLVGILADAARLNKENKPLEAVATLRKAITHVWNRMPLTIKEAVLISEKAPRYGQFSPRPDNVYSSGEPVLIYAEPVGYRFVPEGPGLNFRIACDLNILSPEGKVLAGKRDFGQWSMSCGEPLFEFFMNLTVTLTGASPGQYIVEIVFRDLNGSGQTSIQKTVVVR